MGTIYCSTVLGYTGISICLCLTLRVLFVSFIEDNFAALRIPHIPATNNVTRQYNIPRSLYRYFMLHASYYHVDNIIFIIIQICYYYLQIYIYILRIYLYGFN